MDNFEVGDEILCVKGWNDPPTGRYSYSLKKGTVYTIKEFMEFGGTPNIQLEEFHDLLGGWSQSRFVQVNSDILPEELFEL